MRTSIAGLILVVVVGVAGATAAAGATSPTKTKTVTVGDDFYSPASLTIKKGSTVKWLWQGTTSDRHSVTAASGAFSSRIKRSGSYSHMFAKPGSYLILCKLHPDDMRIRITVKK